MSEEERESSKLAASLSDGTAEAGREIVKAAVAGGVALVCDAGVVAPLVSIGTAFGLQFFESFVSNDQHRLEEALRAEQARELAEVEPKLRENFRRLKEAGHPVSDGDVASTFAHWRSAWFSADPVLRRILKHAFAGAFDIELYESGIVTDLFRILERGNLTYSDLRLLAIVVRDQSVPPANIPVEPDGFSANWGHCSKHPLGEYHISSAAAHGHSLAPPAARIFACSSSLICSVKQTCSGQHCARVGRRSWCSW